MWFISSIFFGLDACSTVAHVAPSHLASCALRSGVDGLSEFLRSLHRLSGSICRGHYHQTRVWSSRIVQLPSYRHIYIYICMYIYIYIYTHTYIDVEGPRACNYGQKFRWKRAYASNSLVYPDHMRTVTYYMGNYLCRDCTVS